MKRGIPDISRLLRIYDANRIPNPGNYTSSHCAFGLPQRREDVPAAGFALYVASGRDVEI